MGTRERRQREFAEREERILDAALGLVREDNLLNLQMARLAERCEYAVGTLYLQFKSKEDLLLALTTRSTRQFLDYLQKVVDWKAPSRERMFAIGVAEMLFLKHYPDHFRISQYALSEVAWQTAAPERRQALLDANAPIAGMVSAIVDDARRNGDLDMPDQNPQEISMCVWALTGGYRNVAHIEGLLEGFEVHDPYALMCQHIQVILNGLEWKPLADPSDARSTQALIQRICTEVFGDACSSH